MNLNTLDIFIDVMQTGSFAEVARRRDIASSSVSRSIASLEDQLGVRLFQRTTRKISPTAAGQAYFARVSPLLDDIKQASQNARDMEQTPRGVLRLTSSVAFGGHVIVPLIKEFMELYPDIQIEYVLSDQKTDIIAERFDVAIRHGQLENSSLIASCLLKPKYKVVASPDYIKNFGQPNTPQDIPDHQLLCFDLPGFREEWFFKDIASQKDASFVPMKPRYILSNASALRALTLEGCGLSLLADWLVDDDIKAGELVDLFPNHIVFANEHDPAIWLVTPSRSYVPLKTRCFLDFLKVKLKIN